MNTPNPLLPQGSLTQAQGKSNVRIAFFTIAAIHVVLLVGGLAVGCRGHQEDKPVAHEETNSVTALPPLGTENSSLVSTGQPPVPAFPVGTNTTTPPPLAPPTVLDTAPAPAPAPVEPASTGTREYVVMKGDSYSAIAKKHGISIKSIEQANPGVSSSRLKVGQKIQLPASATVSAAPDAAPPAPGARPSSDGSTYVVKANDTLTKIAKSHGTTLKAIRAANPQLRTDRITVGQKLKMPGASAAPSEAAAPTAPSEGPSVSPAPGGTGAPGIPAGGAPLRPARR